MIFNIKSVRFQPPRQTTLYSQDILEPWLLIRYQFRNYLTIIETNLETDFSFSF